MNEVAGSPAGRFVASTLDGAERAAKGAPPVRLRLGPFGVDLQPIGDAARMLPRLLRALDPRPAAAEFGSDLRLLLSVGTDGPLGAPPELWPFPVTDRDSFHRVFWSPATGAALTADEPIGLWNLMDRATMDRGAARHLVWIADVERLPSWEFAAPLRHHFHWLALRRDAALVHAAAIAAGGGAVLLTGPGGSGKSTTTVAAVASGREAFAEDLSWVDLGSDAARVRRLYTTFKVTDDSRARYGFVEDFVHAHPHERFDKTLVYRRGSDDAGDGVPLRALYCLSGDFVARTAIEPCSRGHAFRLLAPSTLFLTRTAAIETAARLRRLVDRLPVFHVKLGADPMAAVEAISVHAAGVA